MANVYHVFTPATVRPDATNPASITVNSGTFPNPVIAFDGGSTDEIVYLSFRAVNWVSGMNLDIDWYADTASSGNVVFGGQVAIITPNTDSDDIETKSFLSASTIQDAHLGTTGQRLHRATLAISTLTNLAADDFVCVKFYRDASDTVNDTMTGDAFVTMITLYYSDA